VIIAYQVLIMVSGLYCVLRDVTFVESLAIKIKLF